MFGNGKKMKQRTRRGIESCDCDDQLRSKRQQSDVDG